VLSPSTESILSCVEGLSERMSACHRADLALLHWIFVNQCWHAACARAWLSTGLDRGSRKIDSVQGLEREDRLSNDQTVFQTTLLSLTLQENQRNETEESTPPSNQTNQRLTFVCISSLRRKRLFYDFRHCFPF